MWDMAKSSMTLFFQGRLFADPAQVFRQTALGVALSAVLIVGLAKLGLPLAAAAAIAGLIGGVSQPYLFKNLKYR
jgi:hypothetical protein